MEYVIFNLAGEDFGIPITQVREILPLPNINTVPNSPPFIEGVISLRQHSLAIMDLRKRFRLPSEGTPLSRHVLVVRIKPMIMGLVVDHVSEVLKISSSHIDCTSNFIHDHLEKQMLSGIARVEKKVIFILDLAKVLDPNEKTAMESLTL